MSQHTDRQTLRLLAEVTKRLSNGGLRPADLQALLEGVAPGQSSLDGKIVAEFEGVQLTEANFSETIIYKGQRLKRHRNGGGWVPVEQDQHDRSKPYVAETAYVGPFARVSGNARVYDDAQIYGDAKVFGNAKVYGDAKVYGNAMVCGSAQIIGHNHVSGDQIVQVGYYD